MRDPFLSPVTPTPQRIIAVVIADAVHVFSDNRYFGMSGNTSHTQVPVSSSWSAKTFAGQSRRLSRFAKPGLRHRDERYTGAGSRKRVENALSCYHRGARDQVDRRLGTKKERKAKGKKRKRRRGQGAAKEVPPFTAPRSRARGGISRKLFAVASFLLSRDSPRKVRRENERIYIRTSRPFKTRRFRVVPQAGARAGTASRRLLPAR